VNTEHTYTEAGDNRMMGFFGSLYTCLAGISTRRSTSNGSRDNRYRRGKKRTRPQRRGDNMKRKY